MHSRYIFTFGRWKTQGTWTPWQRGLARVQVVDFWEYLSWKYMRQRQGHCCASFFFFLMHWFFWLWLLWLNLNVGGSCGCGCSTWERSCLIMLWNFYFFNQVRGNFHGLKPQTLPHKWHHGNVSTEFNLLKSGLRVTAAGALAPGAGVRPPTVPAQKAFCQCAASLRLLPPGAKQCSR